MAHQGVEAKIIRASGWQLFSACLGLFDGLRRFWCTEILSLVRFHHGHCAERLCVVVPGIPEQEADSAALVGGLNLGKDVFDGVSLGLPAESLQPRAKHDTGAGGYLSETIHGGSDEMFRSVTGERITVHTEEVRWIDHRR